MALVVLLRGVNVGGHRIFRPTELVKQLQHLRAISIGAAGTFVIREPVSRAELRAEIARRLPFEPHIMICDGRDVRRLMSRNDFAPYVTRRELSCFVSVLARAARNAPATPLQLPATGDWAVRILATDRQFVLGVYRRQMRAISLLGSLDRIMGAPATTRNWNTMVAIARTLDA